MRKSTIETLSITGEVLGIETTDVTPPDKAALLSVLKFSLYSKPGSPTKTLISTIPGIKTFFLRSILSAPEGMLPLATFFPTSFIWPLESIINPPISSILFLGSIILAFIKYFSFINYFYKKFLNMPF